MTTAQIASLPERVDTLRQTVESLINQVDMLFVALNNYEEAPSFLQNNMKITYALMDNALGDAAKFYDADQRSGYMFTCDDDIIYPQGYVGYMIDAIKRHGGIVSLLGKRYDEKPITSFRNGYTDIWNPLNAIAVDRQVHVCGTGLMAYHTDEFRFNQDDCLKPNMADIWVAKAAAEQGVKITLVAHPRDYIKNIVYPHRIWVTSKDDDAYQTELVNSFL
jgi:hypothetical protein